MTETLPIVVTTLLTAAPATASAVAQIPEASSVTLFALGVLGVIVGRTLAKRKSDSED